MTIIIENSSLNYVSPYIWDIVSKCLKIIDKPHDPHSYLSKLECLSLLRLLALKLQSSADLLFGGLMMHSHVLKSLESA